MSIEEEHLNVLENLESIVARLYRKHPEMTDYTVLRVYEALAAAYTAEALARAAKPADLSRLESELFEYVREVCEWRLGRAGSLGESKVAAGIAPIELTTLIQCLKRLVKSVQRWSKRDGRRGYLDFMTLFVG